MLESSNPPAALAPPWTVADAWRGVGLLVLLFASVLLGRRALGLVSGALPPTEALSYGVGLFAIVFQMSLFLPVWVFGLRKHRARLDTLGFRPFNPLVGCGLLIALLVVGYFFIALWGLFLQTFGLRAQPNILPAFGPGETGFALALLAAGILAPLTEESFFRGFFFSALRSRYGVLPGLLISAAVFSVAHLQPLAAPALFVLGLLLALLYHLTGSLWPSILMHATINSVSLIALYAAQRMGIPLS